MKKALFTIAVLANLIITWVLVFKATNNFDTTAGSDWLAGGVVINLLSFVGSVALIVYINMKE